MDHYPVNRSLRRRQTKAALVMGSIPSIRLAAPLEIVRYPKPLQQLRVATLKTRDPLFSECGGPRGPSLPSPSFHTDRADFRVMA